MPTSITVAPGLTQSPWTSRGRPTAATRTSARRQTSREVARARVADGHGGVGGQQQRGDRACRPGRSGRPRPPRRPRAARRGAAAAPSRPTACTGRRPGRPWASRPGRDRREAVDVLARRDLRGQRRRRRPAAASGAGAGCPTRAGRSSSSRRMPLDLVVRRVLRAGGGRSPGCRPRPTPSACRRRRPPTRGRRRPARSRARAARGPRATQAATSRCDLGAHLLRDRLAVDELRRHQGAAGVPVARRRTAEPAARLRHDANVTAQSAARMR